MDGRSGRDAADGEAPTEPARAQPTVPEAAGAEAVPGGTLGRFVIEGMLGAGGMGIVFSTHDPVLDRRVAVKLMRLAVSGSSAEARRARLLREAQALARLTHPNVVTVHEAGVVDNAIFIAMELMEGGTLRDWMAQPHTWRQVLEVFVPAGRGLAAAHAAGLVHRDFKPANVFIDSGGRVKVGDFGLVGVADGTDPSSVNPGRDSPLSATLTETGEAMGTPAYMAPEQVRGERVDARADQYAFCVSLHEALTGQRPGAAEPGRPVPPRLRSVLQRGLADDPAARHPSMDALLDRLQRLLRPRRAALLATAALGIGVAAAATAWWLAPSGTDPREAAAAACAAVPDSLRETWNDQRRASMQAAFADTHLPSASASATRVVDLLDGYTTRWAEARTRACRATHVSREQSEAQLELRMQCLDRRREQLGALAVALSAPLDSTAVDQAVSVAHRLPPPEDCAEQDQLLAVMPLPADPAERRRIEQAMAEVTAAHTANQLGRYAEARKRLDAVYARTLDLQHPPLRSDIQFLRAWFIYRDARLEEAEATYHDSLRQAVAAGDVEREERGWRALLSMASLSASRRAEAELLLKADRLALERAGWPAVATADHLNIEVRMHANSGRLEEAERLARAAVQRIAKNQRWHHGAALDQHALILNLLHRDDEAIRVGTQALQHWEREVGAQHAKVATALGVLARSYRQTGRLDEADAALRRALAVLIGAYGPDSHHLASSYEDLADLSVARQDVAATRAAIDRLLAVSAPLEKTDPESWINTLNQAGFCLSGVGQHDEAVAMLRRALDRAQATGNTRDGAIGSYYLGSTLNLVGQFAEALERCTVAERPLRERMGEVAVSMLALCKADALLGLRQPARAIPLLEEAIVSAEKTGELTELAGARFALARALWQRGDRRRAWALADQAGATFASGTQYKPELARLEAWRKGKSAPR